MTTDHGTHVDREQTNQFREENDDWLWSDEANGMESLEDNMWLGGSGKQFWL